jgi:D-alanyl-D-alanine carboxypeptidase
VRRRLLLAGAVFSAVTLSTFVAGPAVAGVPAKTAAAQPVSDPALLAFRQAIQKVVADGAPGAIGLVRRGNRVVIVTSGLADIATGRRMTAGDRVRIASVGKTYIATLVLQLVAEHRLRLSDSVARWLPGLVPNGRHITLTELLNHTSGIYDYVDDPGFERAFTADPTRVWRPLELVRIAVAHPPLFRPGTRWNYSDTDYILLGLVIEAATRKPLGQQLQARIFTPLHLHATTFPYDSLALPQPYAHGYELSPKGPADVTATSPSIAWAAGEIVSTAGDVARFYSALLAGRLFPARLLREMLHTVPAVPGFRYGLGIMRLPLPCGPVVWGHTGDFPGYTTSAFTTRDDSRQVVILVNAGNLSLQQERDTGNALQIGICGPL